MNKAFEALVKAPKEVKKSEFIKYFMKNYKITKEEAEEAYELYIERYYDNVRLRNMEQNEVVKEDKRLKEQKIKLLVHEKIQNNEPEPEEYKYYETHYNPLEFIRITGPIKKA